MKTRAVYLLLCVVGTVVPYTRLVPFLLEHGPDPVRFAQELFSTRIGAFFGLDVVVSAVTLWVFVAVEGGREKMRGLWAPVAASLVVGVSLGLPLFLYMREARRPRPL